MREPLSSEALEAARTYLALCSADIRRKGEGLFRSARISGLTESVPQREYRAIAEDSFHFFDTQLTFDGQAWSGLCTCPAVGFCPHLAGTMMALLAEHSSAAVRDLSAGVAPTKPPVTSRALQKNGELGALLLQAVGRPLTPEETRFVRKVHQTFLRCSHYASISSYDFAEMGLPLKGATAYTPLHLWPKFPETEHEFWLAAAHAAKTQGTDFPKFMEPITDLQEVERRVEEWKREEEINRWNELLTFHVGNRPSHRTTLVDLRLVLQENGFTYWWKGSEDPEFKRLRSSKVSELRNLDAAGNLQLTPEAQVLWSFLTTSFYYGPETHLTFQQEQSRRVINSIVRRELLSSRITDTAGVPLPRPSEKLVWQLTPAIGPDDHYGLDLVRESGAPPPKILCLLEGTPNLYITPEGIFQGPPAPRELLQEHSARIPAVALEQSPGVAFLQELGVELPERIKARVTTMPCQITIRCNLAPVYAGAKSEDCCFSVTARASDGAKRVWNGGTWYDPNPGQRLRRTKPASIKTIPVYDWSPLDRVPPLFEDFSLRDGMRNEFRVRVTKKFPDLFGAFVARVPPEFELKLEGDLESFRQGNVAGKVKLEVAENEIDWFDLRVVVDVSDTTLTPPEIKLLLNAKGSYVRLEGKGWRRLQFDLSQEEDERLARLGLSPRELSAEPQRLHALQLADDAARKFIPAAQFENIHRRVEELKTRVTPELPQGVKADLRPYQLAGFHFLAYLSTNRFGGILADDMGLGKTLQTLAWLLWLLEQEKPGAVRPPSLVVCPKSVMDNWCAEAARFIPGLKVKVWPAAELDDLKDHLAEADLHVLNYNQLRLLGESLVNVRWLAVILDEGQYIKNPNSQTAQVARALKAGHRLVLSGTPIENRLLDLWSLMSFAMPGVLGSRAQFAKIYDSKTDPLARRRLSARVRPFLLRRTKSQVAKDLPDRVEEDLFCEMEGEQKALYRAELKKAQQWLLSIKTQKELASQQFNFLTSLLRLRQACCHPRLLNSKTTAPSAKVEALIEQLEPLMEEGQRVLVFSQFVELLQILRQALKEKGWPLFYLAGDTENRGDLVREFQATPAEAIFLISLKAGGFGLNLTAASYVVLFDPWWNPAVENQAIDRTHRIGQQNKVMAYRLLIKDSIEEKIRALQKQKRALAEDVLGEEKFAQNLTLNDLRFLFSE